MDIRRVCLAYVEVPNTIPVENIKSDYFFVVFCVSLISPFGVSCRLSSAVRSVWATFGHQSWGTVFGHQPPHGGIVHRASGLASSKGPLKGDPYHFGAALIK